MARSKRPTTNTNTNTNPAPGDGKAPTRYPAGRGTRNVAAPGGDPGHRVKAGGKAKGTTWFLPGEARTVVSEDAPVGQIAVLAARKGDVIPGWAARYTR